jgi:peptidoglycan/LPS O-acetylase OafA/YrhL
MMPPLDGLRGFSMLLVLFVHLRAPDLPAMWAGIVGMGWIGVQMFFVLSGFLITGILLDSREVKNGLFLFWIRRFLRIFPLYYAALVVFLVVLPAVVAVSPGVLPPREQFVYFWGYLNNWVPLPHTGGLEHVLGHFWSLAVEEQFYLVWPLVIWVMPRRWLIGACLWGAGLVFALRTWFWWQGADPWMIYRNTILRSDALLWGALCAALLRDERWIGWLQPRIRRLTAAAWCFAGCVVVASGGTFALRPGLITVGMSAFALAAAMLVLLLVLSMEQHGWLQWWFCHPVLRMTGQYSYGMYVWSWPIYFGLCELYVRRGFSGWTGQAWLALVGAICAYAAAWISYTVLEGPILRLKRYFSTSGAGFANGFGEGRKHLKEVAGDADVGDFEDRRVGVLIDRHDALGAFHAHQVLDGAGDAHGQIELRRDGLP